MKEIPISPSGFTMVLVTVISISVSRAVAPVFVLALRGELRGRNHLPIHKAERVYAQLAGLEDFNSGKLRST